MDSAYTPTYNNRSKGIFLVLAAGCFWSFAGLAVRLIEFATQWQIVFFRSLMLLAFLTCYLLISRRSRVLSAFKDCGWVGFAAGAVLSLAFCTWIWALTHQTVANSLFLLSTAPFIAAVAGWWILGERVTKSLAWAMLIAIIGVGIMVGESYQFGTLFGTLMGLLSATGFALFAVLLRKGRNTDLVPAVFWAGLCASIIAGGMIFISNAGFEISSRDFLLCSMMGVLQIGLGLVIFTHGSRYLPAGEITLLSLTEIVLGPIWVWIVIQEVPSLLTLVGGSIVLSAIAGQAFFTLHNARR